MRTLIASVDSIGRALAQALFFDRVCPAATIESVACDDLDELTLSAIAPLAWAANQAPSEDLMTLRRIQEVLATCRISHITLISTCAVYPYPSAVDEATPITPEALPPYARHRYDLERWCSNRWETTVVRLPRVFGGTHRSPSRNPTRDLARLAASNPASTSQHYDLARLASDLSGVRRRELRLVNLVTPPITHARVLADLLDYPPLPGADAVPPVTRDVRSQHAESLAGLPRYLETEAESLARIAAYLRSATPPSAAERR
ncbi:MAG: hypothetical protein LBD97_01685 [Bifidobacteriaceae bacterium]|nr:hypothetical protein [Bifidobacteriaceae bacterium]